MAIEQAVYQHLTDIAELSAYVSGRIWPNVAPARGSDSDFPCVVYQWTGSIEDYRLSGASGLVQGVIQLTVFARTYLECEKILEVMRSELSGLNAVIGNGAHITDVTMLFGTLAADDYEPPFEGRNFGVFSRRAECRVWYRR